MAQTINLFLNGTTKVDPDDNPTVTLRFPDAGAAVEGNEVCIVNTNRTSTTGFDLEVDPTTPLAEIQDPTSLNAAYASSFSGKNLQNAVITWKLMKTPFLNPTWRVWYSTL
jgi:hypothetical protein